jgi:hypothetical protein
MQAVKDLSIDELKALIAEAVEEKFREMLVAFGSGLALRPEVWERLQSDLKEPPAAGGENIPAAEVARRTRISNRKFPEETPTPGELRAIRRGRAAYERRDYVTLDELRREEAVARSPRRARAKVS